MSGFDEYATNAMGGMKAGAGDIGRSAIADIGDSYQEILMSHASVSPPDGLTGTAGYIAAEADTGSSYIDASYTDVTPPEVPALPAPEIDIE